MAHDRITSAFVRFAGSGLDLESRHLDLLLGGGFAVISTDLARQAWRFNPAISTVDILQATAATQRKRISTFKTLALGLLLSRHEPFGRSERHIGYRAFGRDETLEYERLRAEYDAAFVRLLAAVGELRSITQQLSPDKTAEQAARRRGDQAMGVYHECRDKLAGFLVSLQPAGRSAASMDSKPVGVWMMGTNQRAAGSDDGAFGRRDEVQVLAYRLWERAGRPIGSPDEHWYRAEELLRSGQ